MSDLTVDDIIDALATRVSDDFDLRDMVEMADAGDVDAALRVFAAAWPTWTFEWSEASDDEAGWLGWDGDDFGDRIHEPIEFFADVIDAMLVAEDES